ncbi:tRNA threonylcarbamoyladenosine dehydratase [Faecalibacterium sp. An121]|uniref:tRNA threonylcarbamoyladenosine dehydratase n=1 Tax=Faecalibacterium sp. An121 TaxID=1965550 RepID=UPI000B3771DD|nr:tRNA threonylcarbamoyladenosine dehydratase [Faecalibacterium sp. An121]OUQ39581.1 tRNA threonylcarbamoyladenosine dehydratase [Faecalibacterium sp. An121]
MTTDTAREQYSRTRLLLGQQGIDRLRAARVAVFGVGGVGGYVVEALARSGVGALDLIDDDKVCLSNLNRQIIATHSTLGQYKVDAAAARVRDIDPDIQVRTYKVFYTPETADQFDFSQYSYVVDAIDTVSGKLALVMQARAAGVPVICSMGAGNKLDPTRFEVADLYETSVCPLARVMRAECRKRGIDHLKVVYSKEPPMAPRPEEAMPAGMPDSSPARPGAPKKRAPGSNAFVPSAAGLIIAGQVVCDLTGCRND